MRCFNKNCSENRNNWCMLHGTTEVCVNFISEADKSKKEKTIEEWLKQARTKYIRPGSRIKLFLLNLWSNKKDNIKAIKKLMEDNIIVDAGWMVTDVPGFHNNVIFYKKKDEGTA